MRNAIIAAFFLLGLVPTPAPGQVTHHRRSHVNPALASLSVVRHFRLSGDTLTLTAAPVRNRGTLEDEWRGR